VGTVPGDCSRGQSPLPRRNGSPAKIVSSRRSNGLRPSPALRELALALWRGDLALEQRQSPPAAVRRPPRRRDSNALCGRAVPAGAPTLGDRPQRLGISRLRRARRLAPQSGGPRWRAAARGRRGRRSPRIPGAFCTPRPRRRALPARRSRRAVHATDKRPAAETWRCPQRWSKKGSYCDPRRPTRSSANLAATNLACVSGLHSLVDVSRPAFSFRLSALSTLARLSAIGYQLSAHAWFGRFADS
jgi:hypothetical protein